MAGKTNIRGLAAWLALPALAVLVAAAAPQAQTPRQTGRQVFNYPPPHQLQKKMIIQWGEDRPLPKGGNVLFLELRVDTFTDTGGPGLTMEAPECIFNANEFSGSSPGHLKVRTADTNSFIEGDGYLWSFKGSNLTVAISNNVSTTLKQDFMNAGTNVLNRSTAATKAATNLFVYIHADRVVMDRGAGLATYTGRVHAWDERLDLTCDTLTIRGATNTTTVAGGEATVGDEISEIVADQHVVILDKAAGGRATGDRAVYSAVDGDKVVTLTGNPHWQDGPREATARAFIFQRAANTLRAEGDAHFRLPAGSIGKAGFIMLPQPGAAPTTPAATTNLTDFTAGSITLQLPATNGGPLLGVIAETNVLINDPANDSEASGWRAVYTQTNGTVELTGHASARAGRRLARGELLAFNQNDNSFAARTNAYLQFPPGELKESSAYGNLLTTNAGTTTNQLARFTADSYDFLNQTLTFHGGVHGEYLMDDTVRGTLESGSLEVGFINTNIVREIVAAGGVHLRQLPALDSKGKLAESDFKSDWLQILVRTNEIEARTNFLLEQVTATGSVAAVRTIISTNLANAAHPVTTNRITFAGDRVTATFMPDTNQVSTVVGEGKVAMAQDDYTAEGAKVVYTATNDTVVLTGDPKLSTTNGWSSAYEMIIYDHAHGGIQWIGRTQVVVDLPEGTVDKMHQQAATPPNKK